MKPHRVLAFDPGYERLGVAVIERAGVKDILLYSGCIRTPATAAFSTRLRILGDAASALITQFAPHAVALENIYFEKNAKTAMRVAEVRGMLSYIAAAHATPVIEFTPLEVKVAVTGYGHSNKAAVASMVGKLVSLPERKRLDDELDAIAVGLTCLATTR